MLLATGKYGNPALFAINACLGIYLALVVAEALGTTRAADWFQALGARTISILIVNGVMLQYVNPVLKGSIELQSIYEMALFLLLLVPSLVIANVAIAWACEGPIASLRLFSQRLADRLMVAIFSLVPAWTGASVAERNLPCRGLKRRDGIPLHEDRTGRPACGGSARWFERDLEHWFGAGLGSPAMPKQRCGQHQARQRILDHVPGPKGSRPEGCGPEAPELPPAGRVRFGRQRRH